MAGIDVKVSGLEKLKGALGRSQARLLNQTPLWVRANQRIEELAKIQFATGGALTGGWRPLDPDTVESLREAGKSTRALVTSGTLRAAATRRSADGALHRMDRKSFERGITHRGAAYYGRFHQEGDGVPRRQWLVWRDSDTRWLLGKAGERIVEPVS